MNPIEKLLVALVFCCLLAAMIWIARKGRISALGWHYPAKQPSNQLSVISRHVLTPQHALYLISLAGQTYIVATHPQGLQMLPHSTILPVNGRPSAAEQKRTT